jgi:hypothetical protein
VHIPSDGVPLKGYELAKAEIERRGSGDDAATLAKPSLFAALFGSKSSEEDDEAATAPVVNDKPAATVVAAAKPAEPVPTPRARPTIVATLQFAAADAQIAQAAKPKPQAADDKTADDKTEAKPQTPADIINARGFWDNAPATPQQATPAQAVAAINARQALDSTDPQATAAVPAAYQALAYMPRPSSPVDHDNIVTATAPMPRSARPLMLARNSTPATGVSTVAAKGAQGASGPITNSARIAAANADSAWLRIVMLAPSVGGSLSVTVLGDTDLTLMRAFFVKPQITVNMGFTSDPMMGMACDHFTGSATPKLDTTSFMLHTASLQ